MGWREEGAGGGGGGWCLFCGVECAFFFFFENEWDGRDNEMNECLCSFFCLESYSMLGRKKDGYILTEVCTGGRSPNQTRIMIPKTRAREIFYVENPLMFRTFRADLRRNAEYY